jgi:hypothetical protein
VYSTLSHPPSTNSTNPTPATVEDEDWSVVFENTEPFPAYEDPFILAGIEVSSAPAEPKKPKKSKAVMDNIHMKKQRLKSFEARRDAVGKAWLKKMDEVITGGMLSELMKDRGGLRFYWNNNMYKTAGLAWWDVYPRRVPGQPETYQWTMSIGLSDKLITNDCKLATSKPNIQPADRCRAPRKYACS